MWTDPKINTIMGLQATAATKRKHEITFDSKDVNTYTSCPTPVKSSRWSTNANNNNNNNNSSNNNNNNNISNNNNNNNNNNNSNVNNNNNETTTVVNLDNNAATNKNAPNQNQNLNIHNINSSCNQLLSSCDDNSIAKLEVVAAVPCEPWNSPEPVDCISKLQAVAVPSDPWGSISTRSTLATTLLSADELDDDDDDFEDDYEEEESIIPTYCPLRYHPCGPSSGNHRNYSPAHSYNNNRPNYYSEPFPQQNCSRTGNQHLRMNGNGCGGGGNGAFNHWNNSNGGNSFYVPPEASYPPQQTIRCAENGKSYLELGCSNSTFNTNRIMSNSISNSLEGRHPFKRCCDGRGGTWCNTNKTCYKDTRLKIRNLSMFKLSRFRQVSEQSLYRSVLICNTLKHIDKEIETEAKELHHQQQQQQQQQQHHQHQQHLQHHHNQQLQHPIHSHLSHHHNSHLNNQLHSHHHHHHQHQSQQQQQQQHLNSNDYSPIMGCARVSNVEYHHQNQFHSNSENRGDCSQNSSYSQVSNLMNGNNKPAAITPVFNSNMQHQQQQQQHQQCNLFDSLHPYDHYPFREPSANGRATPFPNSCSSINSSGNSVTSMGTISTSADTDSGYGDDDANRTINWSSVLSLSSQSALDPLNNNDLFSILPPTTITTSANSATTTPASISSCSSSTTPQPVIAITGTFTASTMNNTNNSNNNSSTINNNILSNNSTNARTQSPAMVASQTSTVQQTGTTTMTQLTTKTTPAAATSPPHQFTALTALSTPSTTSLTSLTTISSASLALSASSAVAAAAASIAASAALSSSSSSFTFSNCSGSGSTLSTIATSSASSSAWEYGFLEMDFGLGSEFTELVPSCKLSSDDLFKNVVSPVSSLNTSRYSSVHENELEQPAHIMVGS